MNDELASYQWLTEPEAAGYLRATPSSGGKLATLIAKLRRDLPAQLAQRITQQLQWRERGVAKFSRASEMLFTAKLLEQATDEPLALIKARRFPPGQVVADFCCGCGGDLVALGQRGPVIGVDRDPIAALLARFNATIYGVQAETRVSEVEKLVEQFQWIHIDPDRRATGRRTTKLQSCQPGIDCLDRLLEESQGLAVKLAPATVLPPKWTESTERQWLGSRGECRQQVVWCRALALAPGKRVATVINRAGQATSLIEAGLADQTSILATQIGRFLYEPHAAVLAAGLASTLATQQQTQFASAHGGYLSGDTLVHDGLSSAFEVLDQSPFDARGVRRMLGAHNISQVEIKRRGISDTPDQIRKRLRCGSGQEATLIVTRLKAGVVAALCRRLVQKDVMKTAKGR